MRRPNLSKWEPADWALVVYCVVITLAMVVYVGLVFAKS